ncbi:VanZ family protein [Natrinema salsiterrestre]|uniref:VanZ family protein n=1 Tax=Natrinema salsiterrestre TaxID=2950540 RepID=A0A9Q4L2W8_9EURY|nr:VanZ family protein [Natrinema salsiterrestre]MDF9745873.1 VanZ family protein [Natrinema salsiterrestre]
MQVAVIPPIEFEWFDRRHGIAYAVLACSLEYALADRELTVIHVALLVFAATVGYGVLMEIGQLFRPDRVASMADAASNAVGAGAGLALPGLEKRIYDDPFFSSE